MLAALATLTFLAMLWLVIAIVAATIRENIDQILRALRGEGLTPTAVTAPPASIIPSSWLDETTPLSAAA